MNLVYKLLNKDRTAMAQLARAWQRDQEGNLFCTECSAIPPAHLARPIHAKVQYIPPTSSCVGTFSVPLEVAHKRLIESLANFSRQHVLGECILPNGQPSAEYNIIVYPGRVLGHGGADAHYYVCPVCNGILDARSDNPYFLSNEINDRKVFQNCHGAIFVTQCVAKNLAQSGFRDLELFPVEVRDALLPEDPWVDI